MRVSSIGLDIAKRVFHLVVLDEDGKQRLSKQLKREQVLEYFAEQEVRCVVGIETCGGAHDWARKLQELGYQVKLMSPKAVKAYRTKTKNDYNDARAIAEAATREQVRAIQVKSRAQQDLQAVHKAREMAKKQRNQQANQIRGLVAEYGLVIALGVKALRAQVPQLLEDAENGLSDRFRELLHAQFQLLEVLQSSLDEHDQRLRRAQAQDTQAKRAAEVPGVGVVTSSAVGALHGDLKHFAGGRDFAAAIGLVPRQDSTGGRTRLLGINKHTDPYLRTLFIHGARAVLRSAAKRPDDPLSQWALRVRERRGANIAAVALANKLARITWAVLARDERYCAHKLRGAPA
ncbi:MAG: IS110 family transposase [Gammaproteobacteria bacterium]